MTAPARSASVGRDAATVTTWNLLSRVTGLVRVVVLGGALGATRLGDTYQASNQVSNVLFELLAAGTLSAILVPGLVRRLAHHDVEEARQFAGVVLGRVLVLVVPLVALGAVFARPLARLLFVGNDGPSRSAQVGLGAFLLLFVQPQMLLYAWGAIVTAVLHADGRFAAASLAPVANNLVVAAGLGLLWHRGAHGLNLAGEDKWLLGATALGGVGVMTLVPVLAAWRAGLAVVPTLRAHVDVDGIGRDALWGGLVLVPPQLIAFASLLVAGRAGGGVAAYQIAFTFFLLPYALVAHPTATVLSPRMARAATHDQRERLRGLSGSGLDIIAAALCLAAGMAAALAPWLIRLVAFGALGALGGAHLTATALAWLAVGLPAYGATLLLTRVGYAADHIRMPARCAIVGGVAGGVVLLAATQPNTDNAIVATVALAHTVMVSVAAGAMLLGCVRAGALDVAWARLGRFVVGAAAAGVVARVVATAMPEGDGRLLAAVVVGVATLVGTMGYALTVVALGERRLPRLAGADEC
jgi:putative peptidoglycan lipid II flippase